MRSGRRSARFLGLVFLISLVAGLSGASAAAQALFGAVSGTVTDSSGGVIPGATVKVTNVETGVTKT